MDLKAIKSLVGEPFQLCDNEGNYVGCFAPLYFLWLDLPRYPLPERQSDYFHEAFSRLCENFDVIAWAEGASAKAFAPVEFASQPPPSRYHIRNHLLGSTAEVTSPTLSCAKQVVSTCFDFTSSKILDILVLRLAMGVLHVGIYLGDNQFLHVQRGAKVEITRFSRLSHRVVAILRRAAK